jgi:isocitrate dehydrogenase (NAD+)
MLITVIEGDGIGPEVVRSTVKVLDALQLGLKWEYVDFNELETVYQSIETNRVVLKGPIATPIGFGKSSVNVHLRQKYDLFCNLRPIRSWGAFGLYQGVDLALFRENTEDLYVGIEKQISVDEAHAIKIVTRSACHRIVKAAFEQAKAKGLSKVTLTHKANILKLTDGLFLREAEKVSEAYHDIALEPLIIDNLAMQLVMNPLKYGVVVTLNLYGDILSDMCAGLVGGLGLLPSANIGKEIAIFEPVHGSAPDIAGKGIANPVAMLLSAAMMLDHLRYEAASQRLIRSVEMTLSDQRFWTRDLGGNCNTEAFVSAIIGGLNG